MQQQWEQILIAARSVSLHFLRAPRPPELGCSSLLEYSQNMLTILVWFGPLPSQKYTLLPRGKFGFLWFCYGPRLQINPSRPRGYCKTRFNAGQHKRGRKAQGADGSGLQDRLSRWTATPNARWIENLSLKEIINIWCPVTVTICINQDLEVRGFLERSIVVNQHTMQAFPSHQ